MIGDLERIKRVGVKSRTAGAKKKPKKIVPPHRIGATLVQRDVSSYDRMVESLPIVEPPGVEAISQPTRGREDDPSAARDESVVYGRGYIQAGDPQLRERWRGAWTLVWIC